MPTGVDFNTAVARALTRHLTSADFAEELAEVAVAWESPFYRENIADWIAREFESAQEIDQDNVVLALVVKHSGLNLKRVMQEIDWEKVETAPVAARILRSLRLQKNLAPISSASTAARRKRASSVKAASAMRAGSARSAAACTPSPSGTKASTSDGHPRASRAVDRDRVR